jgi:hypothetical protein
MAKKKVNKRTDYDLEGRDVVVYEKSRIQRKMLFMILRGPGLIQAEVNDENEAIKKLGVSLHFKLKFFQVKTVEEAIDCLKDANVWAGGVVFQPADLEDENQELKKTIKKVLIPVHVLTDPADETPFLDALKTLLKNPSKSKK